MAHNTLKTRKRKSLELFLLYVIKRPEHKKQCNKYFFLIKVKTFHRKQIFQLIIISQFLFCLYSVVFIFFLPKKTFRRESRLYLIITTQTTLYGKKISQDNLLFHTWRLISINKIKSFVIDNINSWLF